MPFERMPVQHAGYGVDRWVPFYVGIEAMNVRLKLLGFLVLSGFYQTGHAGWSLPGEAKKFVKGYENCLRALGNLGHSQTRVMDLANKLNQAYPFTGGHSYHSRELQEVAKSPDGSILVYRVSAHRYHAMRGQPGSEITFLYNYKTNQWLDLGGGDLDAYKREFQWYPSSKGALLAIQSEFRPPHRIEYFDEWPLDTAAFYRDSQGSGNSTVFIDPATGLVKGKRNHPQTTGRDIPFKKHDTWLSIRAGETSWLPNGKAFLEFGDESVSLVRVIEGENGVKFSADLTLSYEEARQLKEDSPNGRVLFGDSDLNAMRDALKSLELVK